MLQHPTVQAKCRKYNVLDLADNNEKLDQLMDTIIIPKEMNNLKLPKKMKKRA